MLGLQIGVVLSHNFCSDLLGSDRKLIQHCITSYQFCFPQRQAKELVNIPCQIPAVQASRISLSREKAEKTEQSEALMG